VGLDLGVECRMNCDRESRVWRDVVASLQMCHFCETKGRCNQIPKEKRMVLSYVEQASRGGRDSFEEMRHADSPGDYKRNRDLSRSHRDPIDGDIPRFRHGSPLSRSQARSGALPKDPESELVGIPGMNRVI